MNAAILSIGDELVTGLTVDTNSSWLAGRLIARGLTVVETRSVPDDRARIAQAIRELGVRVGALVITGGLGPTPDDLTREALGDVLTPGEPLERDEAAERLIERWFARTGRAMPESNRRQAQRPRGAVMIPNAHGTAPGIAAAWGEGGCRILVMPGVPREMKPMFEENADACLPRDDRQVTVIRSIHTCGLGESDLAQRLGSILSRDRQPQVGTAAGGSMVSVRIYARGPAAQAARDAEQTRREVEPILSPYAYGCDGESLPAALLRELAHRGLTIATAESCTGGLAGQLITSAPGSSAWYRGGWVTYSNDLKVACLDVPMAMIRAHGAVSEPVACAMAGGALRRAQSNLAVSITGVAGPDGGTEAKPVGTVWIGCGRTSGDAVETWARHFRFGGDREAIRERAARTALQMARWAALGVDRRTPLLGEVVSTMAESEPRP